MQELSGLDDQTDKWLRAWISEVANANWKQAKDVLRQFPQAKCITDNVIQFRVEPQAAWIEVALSFSLAVAIVCDLKRTN
ncbi:Uncharacterized protein conserved in bacteria [Burkholderia pseudomallei]|uniref:type II toxin-antitoxin system HigB family toxin n=1 Tax=Burkholderia pseudomallei TaxID=28450 RepID=UPI000F243607|nr:type II toxin-antitoxin system HigB family toxin [Burkholderia pseudomallei]VCS85332.1 Uncharacterized protein conserved in bacteria [Burkholderia pseudomallei]